MADITVTVQGANAVIAGLDGIVGQLQAEIDAAIQSAGLLCEAQAKANCPVDTGLLRGSITYQNDGPMSCSVGTNVSYAAYVELGTSRMAAQPYLFPAFASASAKLEQVLKNL